MGQQYDLSAFERVEGTKIDFIKGEGPWRDRAHERGPGRRPAAGGLADGFPSSTSAPSPPSLAG